jgi:hypothetical protein
MSLAEFFTHPLYMFGLGLALGLWVAVNAWILGRGFGYGQGVRYCLEAVEPLRIELMQLAGLHHVTEEMRLRMQAEAEAPSEETRH